jgi:pimeloyl-ACP methyl ester carboxylesterase
LFKHLFLKTISMLHRCLLVLLSHFFLVTLLAQSPKVFVPAGVEYQWLNTYGFDKLGSIVSAELDTFLYGSPMPANEFKGKFEKPQFAVKLYKVKYLTRVPEWGQQPITVTGLIAIPDNGKDSMPIISYQHGTVFSKTAVPSFPEECMEYKLMVAQYASNGYVVIGADYIGLGESDLPNGYLIKESTEQACVDMILAAKDVLKSMNIKPGSLFLHGWSQGGWNTMTLLRKLEEIHMPVTAATTAAAPVDVAVTINRWMNNYQPGDAIWLTACASNLIFAFERYYKMPGLSKNVIRPEYYTAAENFADFKIDWPTFSKQVPSTIQAYFNPAFMQSGNIATSGFWKILEASQAYRWRCQTPLRNYYGEQDEVIPVFIATLPQGFHTLMGGANTKSISAGAKADHRATHVFSVIDGKKWFDSYLKR